MNRIRGKWMVFLLLGHLLLSGCRSSKAFPYAGRAPTRPIPLLVENDNFLDVTIFARGSGASVRLGDVTGKGKATFSIDPKRVSMTSGLELVVDPLGSTRTFVSSTLYPGRGTQLYLRVAAELQQSYATMR